MCVYDYLDRSGTYFVLLSDKDELMDEDSPKAKVKTQNV